jgi:hypothetical protein
LPDGRVVLSVGDVSRQRPRSRGHDGQRAAEHSDGGADQSLIRPRVLDAVDRIVRAMGHGPFVTAFVAVFDPVL